jgi:hypothetical protein
MPLSAAERMRATRARRAEGFRVIPLEVRTAEIDGLITRGYLTEADRGDRDAVATALGRLFDAMTPKSWPACPQSHTI